MSAAFSPDGQRIVTASADKTARIWDAASGKPIGEPLRGHTGAVASAAFSPDGKRIVTASADNTARLWDAATGQPIGAPLTGHGNWVQRAAFSPDGKRVVTASWDKTARLWDAETGKQIGDPLKGHEQRGVERGVQSRWPTHRHRVRGPDCAAVGRVDRSADRCAAQRPRRNDRECGIQPRRQARRHRFRRQNRAPMGHPTRHQRLNSAGQGGHSALPYPRAAQRLLSTAGAAETGASRWRSGLTTRPSGSNGSPTSARRRTRRCRLNLSARKDARPKTGPYHSLGGWARPKGSVCAFPSPGECECSGGFGNGERECHSLFPKTEVCAISFSSSDLTGGLAGLLRRSVDDSRHLRHSVTRRKIFLFGFAVTH